MQTRQKLVKAVERLKHRKLLVVGDLMVDEDVYGKTTRISPEAPLPVVHVESKRYKLGGAGNVISNIKALGGDVLCAGIIGNDGFGRMLKEMLEGEGLKPALFVDGSRPTTRKTRIFARSQGGYRPVGCRLDEEKSSPIPEKSADEVLRFAKALMGQIDCIVLSDYNKGVLNNSLSSRLIQLARSSGRPVLVDPKPENIEQFKGCTVVTPNKEEATRITGIAYDGTESLERIGRSLFERLGPDHVIVTCGEDGMFIYNNKGFSLVPTKAVEVNDVTGAGDTVIATLALGIAARLSINDAAELANYAAGVVISKLGTATVSPDELKEYILAHPHNSR